ncbi:hypothetical protein BX266_3141 [Streptomyces sp. TLI_171]|nr:hypothetical protein BX266_3141 [Streptomyces sp. TLI_171]
MAAPTLRQNRRRGHPRPALERAGRPRRAARPPPGADDSGPWRLRAHPVEQPTRLRCTLADFHATAVPVSTPGRFDFGPGLTVAGGAPEGA